MSLFLQLENKAKHWPGQINHRVAAFSLWSGHVLSLQVACFSHSAVWALCSIPDLSPSLTYLPLFSSYLQKNLLYIQSVEALPPIAVYLKFCVLHKVSPDSLSQASPFLTHLSLLFCGPFLHPALHVGRCRWPPTWLENAWRKDISGSSQSLSIASKYSWTSTNLILNLPRMGGRVSVFCIFLFQFRNCRSPASYLKKMGSSSPLLSCTAKIAFHHIYENSPL